MLNYVCVPLRYTSNSGSLMSRLAQLQRPVFLDCGFLDCGFQDCGFRGNGAAREHGGNFDILAAEPVAWIQVMGGSCCSSDPEIPVSSATIFNAIRLLRTKYNPVSDNLPDGPASLPFWGGLLGYLGYPTLQQRAELLIQDAYIGVYQWAVVVDHRQQQTTLVLRPGCTSQLRQRLLPLLQDDSEPANLNLQNFSLLANFQQRLSRSEYDSAFQTIKSYIQAGDCYQVNLTQQFSAACTGQPIAAYLRLRQTMPAPFSAFIGWPQGALLSVSPERFLQLRHGHVQTQPIKGTRPRAKDPHEDRTLAQELMGSEKDRAENLMIVDLLRNDLGRVCATGSIVADQLFNLASFSNVHHLVSTITGQLAQQHDALDLLQACFPGGSITGAPKLRAMEIIEELELAPRRVYCGTAFYLCDTGNLDSSITIRSLLWESGQLHCWAGGGIVHDSEADAEYAECFHKIRQIIDSLTG